MLLLVTALAAEAGRILSFFLQSGKSIKKQHPGGQSGHVAQENISCAAIQLFHSTYHKHFHYYQQVQYAKNRPRLR